MEHYHADRKDSGVRRRIYHKQFVISIHRLGTCFGLSRVALLHNRHGREIVMGRERERKKLTRRNSVPLLVYDQRAISDELSSGTKEGKGGISSLKSASWDD